MENESLQLVTDRAIMMEPQQPHHHHHHPRNVVTTGSGKFVSRFCCILIEIHKTRLAFSFFVTLATVINHIQLACACGFPMDQNLWEVDQGAMYWNLISSFFTRLVPVSASYQATMVASFFLFAIVFSSFFAVFWLFFAFKPTSLFMSDSVPYVPIFPLFLLRILHFPMISLTVYFVYERARYGAVTAIVFSALSVAMTTAGIRFYDWVLHGFPQFKQVIGVYWSLPPFYVHNVLFAFVFVVCESYPYIDDKWEKIMSSELCAAIFLYFLVDAIVTMRGVTEWFNTLRIWMYMYCTGFAITAPVMTKMVAGWTGLYTAILLFSILPIFIIGSLISHARVEALRKIVANAIQKEDFGKFDKLPTLMKMSTVGHGFGEMKEDLMLLDRACKMQQENFALLLFYAKFIAISMKDYVRLHEVVTLLKSLRSMTFFENAMIMFLDFIGFHEEHTANQRMITELCSVITDDYFRTLTLFWTEILLGRRDRLTSLAIAADEKYRTTVNLFALVGTGKGKNSALYDHFCAATTVRLRPKLFGDGESLLELLYDRRYGAIKFSNQEKVMSEKEFKYKPPLNSVHVSSFVSKSQEKIFALSTALTVIPFVVILGLFAAGMAYVGIVNNDLAPTWSLFSSLTLTTAQMNNVYTLHTFLLLSHYDSVDFTMLANSMENNFLFDTKLADPYKDMDVLLTRLVSEVQVFMNDLETYNFPELVRPLNEETIDVTLTTFSGAFPRSMNFTQYLSLVIIRFREQANMDLETLISYFNNTNRITLIVANWDSFLDTISTFLEDFYANAESYIVNLEKNRLIWFEGGEAIALAVMIIVCGIIIAVIGIERRKLFDPLLALPKVAVSELFEKLSSQHQNTEVNKAQLDNQTAYNLKQMSLEKPSQDFSTSIRSQGRTIGLFIVFVIIMKIIMLIITVESRVAADRAFEGLYAKLNAYQLQMVLQSMLRDWVELYDRELINMTVPENRNELLAERLANKTTQLRVYLNFWHEHCTDYSWTLDPQFFVGDITNLTNSQFQYISFLDKIGYIYITTYGVLQSYEKNGVLDKAKWELVLSALLAAITAHVPDLLFDSDTRAIENLTWMTDQGYLLVAIMVGIGCLLMLLFIPISMFKIEHKEFAVPVISSIPAASLQTFHQKLGASELGIEKRRDDDAMAMEIFKDKTTFQTLIDPLLFMNVENKIIAFTPATISLFEIDSFEPNTVEFLEFLNGIRNSPNPNPDVELTLPPIMRKDFDFVRVQKNGMKMLVIGRLIPVTKFKYQGHTIAYACTFEDATKLNSMIVQLNYEANQVRLLTAQLVTGPALPSFLDDIPFQPVMITKLAIASFIVTSDGFTTDVIQAIQKAIRDVLHKYPRLLYFGRSVQLFRVVSGLESVMTPTEVATEVVNFAKDLIDRFKETKDITASVRCGIHISGPFYGDVISEMPPIFELFGTSMSLSQEICAAAPSNHIVISRDVYESIFDQGFEITFEKEITTLAGESMSLHTVRFQ